MLERTRYKDRKLMQPVDIAEVMLKMIEQKAYSGGTCVLKTLAEERNVEDGWDKQEGKYDPSPRPEVDLGRIRELLEKERGRPWAA